jgi:peroxin-4
MIARSKLTKELKEAMKNKSEDVYLSLLADGLFQWKAFIKGPPDSPFCGHWFLLNIIVPPDYPMAAPKIKFITKVFHPNIHYGTGEICLDILKSDYWTPAWTLESVCRAIISLLANPNADSPLNCDCGNILRAGDTIAYKSLASMYAIEYGLDKPVL